MEHFASGAFLSAAGTLLAFAVYFSVAAMGLAAVVSIGMAVLLVFALAAKAELDRLLSRGAKARDARAAAEYLKNWRRSKLDSLLFIAVPPLVVFFKRIEVSKRCQKGAV